MRLPVLLFLVAACLTARAEPLPEIKVGTSGRVIEIAMTPWYPGGVSTSAAFLAGTVTDVASEVQTSPQQTWLAESCVVRVERAFGHLPQLEGISIARLKAGYDHSPYEPVDPSWGTLRHLQKGRRILLLVHEYERKACFGSEALIGVSHDIQDLPRILRRTAFDPAHFTRADLAVLKVASPALYDHVAEMAKISRETERDDAAAVNALVLGCVTGFMLLLLVIDLFAASDLVTRSTHQSACRH